MDVLTRKNNRVNTTRQKIKSVLNLSWSLAKANFKLRNEGSFLGIFWYLLEPLAFFLILYLISDTLGNQAIEKYPIYLFIGLVMFNFFNAVTTNSIRAILDNASFIKSLKIQNEAFVFSGVLQFIFSHIFELIALIILALIFNFSFSYIVFYPLIFIFFALFTAGIALILSVWGVYVGDLRNVWLVFSRLLWFATPIFYLAKPGSTILKLNYWNPLFYFIDSTRIVLISHALPSKIAMLVMAVSGIAVFTAGLMIFEKFKNRLAEKL